MMKFGDRYKHFKGKEYVFLGISQPLSQPNGSIDRSVLSEVGVATNTETLDPVILYDIPGIPRSGNMVLFFTDTEFPFVIYRRADEEKLWARPVDDFFGCKQKEDGSLVKRFTLLEK